MIKFLLMLSLLAPSAKEQKPLYRDASATPEARTEDLLSRMTLDEKIAQLECAWLTLRPMFTDGKLDWQQLDTRFINGLGQVGRISENKKLGFSTMGPEEAAQQYNEFQRYFVEHTRLGIPMMTHEEGLHGHQAKCATVLPMPLGMSCSWDEDLYREAYTMVAKEIRATGGHEVLAPVVDVAREPRWGRTEETMGEDPYLIGRLGVAQIQGYQGQVVNGCIDDQHVAATLKHFGIHAVSEGGHNKAASYVDEITAMDVYLRPFKTCIEQAQPWNVMITYPEIWGVPAHGNKKLIDEVLRGKFGFQGMTVSDYCGVQQIYEDVNAAESIEDAALMALTAGLDIELPEPAAYSHLKELVEAGRLDEKVIDTSVRRILLQKFRLGLFEHPYIEVAIAEAAVGNAENRAIAYRAATESIVLLQNENNTLPFDRQKIKTLAVIGPNAAVTQMGGYTDKPRQAPSVLEAIQERVGNDIKVLYAEGCKIVMPGPMELVKYSMGPNLSGVYQRPTTVLATEEVNAPLIAEAIEVARQADAVILCLGSNSVIAKEDGDTPSLELLGAQNELAQQIAQLGKPTAALIITGTPNNLSQLRENTPAILQCYYLGQEGGYAMVDALFGEINPSGKLTMSIPRGADHLPAYYSQKRGASTKYTASRPADALYPFGFGLSYTTYEYSNARLSANQMSLDGSVDLLVDVTNTGIRDGAEIVQMYIKDDYSQVVRPAKELKGFARVELKAGETKTVKMSIDRSSLEYYNADIELVADPGTFTIMVGPSSNKIVSTLTLTVVE